MTKQRPRPPHFSSHLSPPPGADMQIQTLKLSRDQNMHVWLPAGSLIVSNTTGACITEAPVWQAGRLHVRRTVLDDGQSMSLEQPGWADISAPQGGEVLCLRPEPYSWRRAWQTLMRLLRLPLRSATGSGVGAARR